MVLLVSKVREELIMLSYSVWKCIARSRSSYIFMPPSWSLKSVNCLIAVRAVLGCPASGSVALRLLFGEVIVFLDFIYAMNCI